MNKMTKKLVSLLCAMIMVIGCLVGCGTKEDTTASTSKETNEVGSNNVESTSSDYGTLLMESEILKVYAKDNIMTFDCNNEEGIEDYRIKIYTNDENCLDVFSHDSWIGDEPSKNGIYSCSIDEDGAYSVCLNPDVDETNEMYDGFYSFDFECKEGKIDTNTVVIFEDFEDNPLPKLTSYASTSNEGEESSNDDIADTDEMSFIIEGKELSYPLTYESLKYAFEDYDVRIYDSYDEANIYELDEDRDYESYDLDYIKNGATFLELPYNDGVLKGTSFYFITLYNVDGVTFSVNLGENCTITNSTTKSEILEMSNELIMSIPEENDRVFITMNCSHGNITIMFDGENISYISIL